MRRTPSPLTLVLFLLVSTAAASACSSAGSDAPPTVVPDAPDSATGDAATPPDTDASPPREDADAASAPRSLGTISGVTPGTGGQPCAPGATCTALTVTCPGIEDLQAIVAVRLPAGAPKGTIYVHGGGGGDQFYATNVDEYVNAGYRVAMVRWTADWEQSLNEGIKAGACRPATVMKWVFDNVQSADRKTGFCAVGFSGGSGVLGYSLAHYGAGSMLDYAALVAGPPFGRIDYGCAPSTYSGPARSLCPELADAPIALPTKLDPWSHTTTCGSATPSAADIAKWTEESVVSPGASYDYPSTKVEFFDCATNSNGTAGGAYFLSQKIVSPHSVSCFTSCSGEPLGPAGLATQRDALLAGCAPRH
jgi:hypothetical protein